MECQQREYKPLMTQDGCGAVAVVRVVMVVVVCGV
jgi:phage-related tail fiber protein